MTIRLNSLTYYYRQPPSVATRGVEGISLQILPGELVGVVGPSGSGKSCLLRCLAGALRPTDGQIYISVAERLPKIGLVMQEPECQFFLDTVYEEVAFALTLQGCRQPQLDRAVNRVLRQVGYDGDYQASPFRLSGGQQRRVALASILITEPDILLLDEPTVGMDAAGLEILRTILAKSRQQNTTVLLVSHDQDFLYRQVDRVLLMKDGQLQADFSKRDWLQYAERLSECGVTLPELLQLSKRNLPEPIRDYLLQVMVGANSDV
jgi:energy-coupling factor transport system ATP-binding protein